MNRILAILTLLTLTTAGFAQYDADARKALDAMSSKYKSIGVFTVDFEQKLTNKASNVDESLSGKITVKGEKYKLELLGQEILHDGTDVYTYNEEINEVTIAPADEDEDEITLSNVYDLYKDGYKYGIESTTGNGTRFVDLEPEKRDKSFFKIRMEILSDNSLKSFSVFEPNGNIYSYSVKNFKERKDLSDSFFVFDPNAYQGIDVVDFR